MTPNYGLIDAASPENLFEQVVEEKTGLLTGSLKGVGGKLDICYGIMLEARGIEPPMGFAGCYRERRFPSAIGTRWAPRTILRNWKTEKPLIFLEPPVGFEPTTC